MFFGIDSFNQSAQTYSSGVSDANMVDCQDPSVFLLKSFFVDLIPYMYPATIEFSITFATLFMIMWTKIGKTHRKHYALPPTKKKFEGLGAIKMPYSNQFIMLDCTKTSKGLFFGIVTFVCTLLCFILFIIYKSDPVTRQTAVFLSEGTEIMLLIVALILTSLAFKIVRRNYTKVIPQTNLFDVVLEIVSLCGVYGFSVNSLIAIIYKIMLLKPDYVKTDYAEYLVGNQSMKSLAQADIENEAFRDVGNNLAAAIAAVLSIVQATLQTLFILECLRRYAEHSTQFVSKPAREIITALLITNLSLWFFDTFSAKRFDTKEYLIAHFGILKWSIINAFSSPLAIFYRFHSSVCLSDIWYGLYYGEYEKPEKEEETTNGSESDSIDV
jgi:hypothetical protein